jgi:hypothetical protein
VPNQPNCEATVRVYLDNGDPVMAINVWDNDMVLEAVKYAEHIIGSGIKL